MSTMGYVTTLTGAEDAASLNLDFEKQSYKVMEGGKQVVKSFSDLISFTRSTTGGCWDSKGVYGVVQANQPRLDYNPLTKVLNGLLVEEQRTNLGLYSDQCIVQATRATYIATGEVFIDSASQFKKLAEDTSNGSHFGLPTSVTVQPDTTYTFSYFIKAAGRSKIQFQLQNAASWVGSPGPSMDVDLVAKTITGVSSLYKMQEIGNGIFRVSITVTTKGASTGTVAFQSSLYPILKDATGATTYTGDGVSGAFIGGYQVEQANTGTSYINTPTTFTSRSTTATYFDNKGILRTAGVNIARSASYMFDQNGKLVPVGLLTEAASVNLLLNSSNFSATAWAPYSDSGATVTTKVLPNRGISPSGEMDADLLVMGTANCLLTQNLAATPSLPYTMSVWMKGVVGGEKVRLEFRSVTSQGTSWGSPITLTKEWVRYTVSGMNSAIEGSRGFQFRKNTVDGGEQSFYIWGAQIEQNSLLSSYIPTALTFTARASTATYIDSSGVIQTAAVNVPRSEAFSRTGKRIGLLVEFAATNFVKYSNGIGTGWTDTSNAPNKLTVTGNATISPDGTNTATLIDFPSKEAGTTQTWNQQVGQLIAGTVLSPSVWLKADRPVTVNIRKGDGVAGYENAQVTTEWQRFESAPGTNTGTTFNFGIANILSATTTPFKLYVWGAQLEYGNYATSEIVTAEVAVTRAADTYTSSQTARAADLVTSTATTRAADLPQVSDITSWYNSAEGTLYVEAEQATTGTSVANFVALRGVETYHGARIYNSTTGSSSLVRGSASTDVVLQSVGRFSDKKRALRIKAGDYAYSTGGVLTKNASAQTITPTRLEIGSGPDFRLNGWVSKVAYYKVALTDSQLQIITA